MGQIDTLTTVSIITILIILLVWYVVTTIASETMYYKISFDKLKKRISNIFYPKDTYFGKRCYGWLVYPGLKFALRPNLIYKIFLAGKPCQGCGDCKPELSSEVNLKEEMDLAIWWWSTLPSKDKASLISQFHHLLGPEYIIGNVLTNEHKLILSKAHSNLINTAAKYNKR